MNLKLILVALIFLAIGAGSVLFFSNNKITLQLKNTPAPTPALEVTSTPSPSSSPVSILPDIEAAMVAKHGQQFAGLNYSVSKIEGDFAKGMVNGTGGGGLWFAAKVNGNWVIVWDGNGIIQCSDVLPYPNFPADLIPQCWDNASQKMITR